MIGVGVNNAYISRLVSFRTLCYTAVFALIALVFLAFNPAVNVISRAEDEIEPVTEMTVTSGDLAATVDIINPHGAFVESDAADITVTTNNYTGYTLRIRASSDDEDGTKLVYGDNAIESISSASTAEEFGSQNWGILPSKYNSSENLLYQPAPTIEGAVLDVTDSPNEEANAYTLAFGVKVDGLLPVGTYNNTFIIEASGNPASYTIDYDDAGGAIINTPDDEWGSSTEAEVYISEQIPERTGYDYVSWCSGDITTVNGVDSCSGTTYQPGDAIYLSKLASNDIRLKSMWSPTRYTISYNLNGGSATNPTEYNIVANNITLSNPTRNGYTFTGWTGTGISSASTSVTIATGSIGNRSYTANWTPTNYTISYTLNGGSATNNTSYNIETNSFTLTNPTRTGYTFKGWSGTGLSGDSNKTVTIAKDQLEIDLIRQTGPLILTRLPVKTGLWMLLIMGR